MLAIQSHLGWNPSMNSLLFLYLVSKIGEEDLIYFPLMRHSNKIEIKVIMQYWYLPKSRISNDVSSPISLGMEPVKELLSVSQKILQELVRQIIRVTNFMIISGIYDNERHLQKEIYVIAVNVPISLGIEPVKEFNAYKQHVSNHIQQQS